MKRILSPRMLAPGAAVVAALLLATAVQAGSSHRSRAHLGPGALVGLRKTALGSILVDAHGRTLYLFEKDRNGVSMCGSACTTYWPPLTSHGAPRAGKGVRQSLLRLTRARNGVRQVSYAGHPLYRFVGDTRPGQTAGEGLDKFGAEWYALASNGRKVETDMSEGDSGSSASSGGYGGW